MINKTYQKNFTILTPVFIAFFLIITTSLYLLNALNGFFYFLIGFTTAIIILKAVPNYVIWWLFKYKFK